MSSPPPPSVRQPANAPVIAWLAGRQGPDDDRPPRADEHDYWEAGSHPDVVERIWNQLGRTLPIESRRVVCGTPALLHPTSRVLIAVAIGTQYVLRLPSALLRSGVPATVRTETTWSGGGRMDVRAAFGPEWVFGSYTPEEEAWCRASFQEHA